MKSHRICAVLLGLYLGCSMLTAGSVRSLSVDGSFTRLNGRHALLVGDSVTQGWMELGTDYDWKAYLDALARNGCNTVMLWSYIGVTDQASDSRIGYDAPEIWPWERTGGKFDLSRPNRLYFRRLGDFVRDAGRKGIVVVLTVHDGWTKTRFAGHPFNMTLGGPLSQRDQYIDLHDYRRDMPDSYDPAWTWQQRNQFYQEQYCRQLIEATSKYGNVIYELFNEGEWYDQAKLDRYQLHFLEFFGKRTKCPVMVNERPKLKANPSCSMYSLHQPNWSRGTNAIDSFSLFSREGRTGLTRPLFFSEPVPEYQGDEHLNQGLMRLMWGTVLAGAGFVVQNDCSFGFGSRSAMAAAAKQRDAVLAMEGNCARYLRSVNLDRMLPHGDLSSSGICLACPGREYLVYTQNRAVSVDLREMKGHASFRIYDPVTGVSSAWRDCGTGTSVEFDTGSDRDRVLHIR